MKFNLNFVPQPESEGSFGLVLPVAPAVALFNKIQAMTREALNQLMLSPSRAAGHINRSTKLPLAADLMLPAVANECGFASVSEFMREAALFYASAKKAAHASALKAAMHIPAIGCLLLTSWIYAQPLIKGTFDGSVEMRKGRTVRIQRSRDQFNFEEVV